MVKESKLKIDDYLNNVYDETEEDILSKEYIDELNRLVNEVRKGKYVLFDEL